MRGPATSAIMRFGTGYGEMAQYGISNEYHTKIAYSSKDALVKVLEEVGLHPDNNLYEFELSNFIKYIQFMERFGNFPLMLNSKGVESYQKLANAEEVDTHYQTLARPHLSKFRIGDICMVKTSSMRQTEDMVGSLYNIDFYVRGEEVLNLLNSDFIEFKADTAPSLLAVSIRDGLQNFYVFSDEMTFVEGFAPANIYRKLSDTQALSISLSIVEALFSKVFAHTEMPSGLPAGSKGSGKLNEEIEDLQDLNE